MTRVTRVKKLEAKRARWEAEHFRISDVSEVLLAVYGVLETEAGEAIARRFLGRMVTQKAEQVEALRLRRGGL